MTFLEQILLTIATASATAVLANFFYWRQVKAELKKEYESRFNERKWKTYLKFVKQIPIGNMLNERTEIPQEYMTPERDKYYMNLIHNFNDALDSIEGEIILIGSTKVVDCFLKWKDIVGTTHSKDEEIAKILIDTINAMREDLGKDKYLLPYKMFSGYYYLENLKLDAKS